MGRQLPHPDGMHFEWVGEDRSQISYPSTYCPNRRPAASGGSSADRATSEPTSSRTVHESRCALDEQGPQ